MKKLISSNEPLEKVTGLSTLISLAGVANESSLNTIAVHFLQLVSLRNILSKDEDIIILASLALGKLLSAPTTTTYELADEEFRYALNTLKNDVGFPRFAACCEIKEMAQRLPILFAVYLGEFLNVMWNALRDQKDYIREAGLQTFVLALKQLETREELFEKVYAECFKGLQAENTPPFMLGSVIVLKEMLEKQSQLLLPHLQDICIILLRNKDHKTAMIKQAFLELIPPIIGFIYAHKRFEELKTCEMLVEFIFKIVTNTTKDQKADAMVILGQIATIAGNEFVRNISQASSIINLELKKKPLQVNVFDLLKGITKTLGPKISEYFDIGSLISTVTFYIDF